MDDAPAGGQSCPALHPVFERTLTLHVNGGTSVHKISLAYDIGQLILDQLA